MPRRPALISAFCLCVLVGALLGVTVHDAEHVLGDGDASCGVCLHAERADGAATAAPPVAGTHRPDVAVDVRRVVGVFAARAAREHRPRAPPHWG